MHRAFALAIALAVAGCADTANDVRDPITTPGKVSLFDGKLDVEVTDDGTTTRFTINPWIFGNGLKAGGGGTWEAESASTAGWFIFPESANKVWLYKGAERLTLIESTEKLLEDSSASRRESEIKVRDVDLPPGHESTAAALDKAPKAVLERLPTSFWAAPKGE